MKSRIGMWGGSCALRLPKMAVDSLGLHDGESVHLHIENGALVVRPAKQQFSLEELVEAAKKMRAPEALDDAAIGDEVL